MGRIKDNPFGYIFVASGIVGILIILYSMPPILFWRIIGTIVWFALGYYSIAVVSRNWLHRFGTCDGSPKYLIIAGPLNIVPVTIVLLQDHDISCLWHPFWQCLWRNEEEDNGHWGNQTSTGSAAAGAFSLGKIGPLQAWGGHTATTAPASSDNAKPIAENTIISGYKRLRLLAGPESWYLASEASSSLIMWRDTPPHLKALCLYESRHMAPDISCTCGIYSVSKLSSLPILRYEERMIASRIIVSVKSWGKVLEGTKGYRAERVVVDGLMTGLCVWCEDADVIDAVEMIGCEVFPMLPSCARHADVLCDLVVPDKIRRVTLQELADEWHVPLVGTSMLTKMEMLAKMEEKE